MCARVRFSVECLACVCICARMSAALHGVVHMYVVSNFFEDTDIVRALSVRKRVGVPCTCVSSHEHAGVLRTSSAWPLKSAVRE